MRADTHPKRGRWTRQPAATVRSASAVRETAMRLAIRRLPRTIIELGPSTHSPVIGFGDRKYVRTTRLFSRRVPFFGFGRLAAIRGMQRLPRTNRVLQDQAERSTTNQRKTERCRAIHNQPQKNRMLQSVPRSSKCFEDPTGRHRTFHGTCREMKAKKGAVSYGKMWDCKTSKMSQSPHAALNAFGLFAAGPRCE